MTCLLFYLRYPHNALRFTNHVGEQRNFCKQKCDVPFLVCLSNSTLSAQRSAYFFKTLYGTTFPHTARLHKFMNNQTLPLRAGCRGRQPLQIIRASLLCRKIATLVALFLPHACVQLWSAMPIPHSSLLIPHSACILSAHICIY